MKAKKYSRNKSSKSTKSRTPALVTISALALSAAAHFPAHAQVVVNCPQELSFGKMAVCGAGTLTITPNGGTNTGGCVVVMDPGHQAICVIDTGGVAPTKNVKVSVTTLFIHINDGGNTAPVDQFGLLHTGTATAKAYFTFTPTQVSNKVTMNVGARLTFTASQPVGSYSGSIIMTAN